MRYAFGIPYLIYIGTYSVDEMLITAALFGITYGILDTFIIRKS